MQQRTPPIVVQPQFSRYMLMYFLFVFGGAIVCVNLLEWRDLYKILMICFLLTACVYYLRRYVWRNGPACIDYLLFDPHGFGEMRMRNHDVMTVEVLSRSIANRFVIILYFRISETGKVRSLLLCSDSESPECLAALRTQLALLRLHQSQ